MFIPNMSMRRPTDSNGMTGQDREQGMRSIGSVLNRWWQQQENKGLSPITDLSCQEMPQKPSDCPLQ